MKIKVVLIVIISCLESVAFSQSLNLMKRSHFEAEKIMAKVIEWRHDIHEYPELYQTWNLKQQPKSPNI